MPSCSSSFVNLSSVSSDNQLDDNNEDEEFKPHEPI